MLNIKELTSFIDNSAAAIKRWIRRRQLEARLLVSNPADNLKKLTDFTLSRAVIKRLMRRILARLRSTK